jgi:cytochrome c
MGDGHPIAWCHENLGGRAFYTALGHTVEAYAEPGGAHLAGGLRYATGY